MIPPLRLPFLTDCNAQFSCGIFPDLAQWGFAPHISRDSACHALVSSALTLFKILVDLNHYTRLMSISVYLFRHAPPIVCLQGLCRILYVFTDTYTADYQPTTVFCRNRIQMRLTPASLVTALNSIPLLGERSFWQRNPSGLFGLEPKMWEPKSHALPFGDSPMGGGETNSRRQLYTYHSTLYFVCFRHIRNVLVLWVCPGYIVFFLQIWISVDFMPCRKCSIRKP